MSSPKGLYVFQLFYFTKGDYNYLLFIIFTIYQWVFTCKIPFDRSWWLVMDSTRVGWGDEGGQTLEQSGSAIVCTPFDDDFSGPFLEEKINMSLSYVQYTFKSSTPQKCFLLLWRGEREREGKRLVFISWWILKCPSTSSLCTPFSILCLHWYVNLLVTNQW